MRSSANDLFSKPTWSHVNLNAYLYWIHWNPDWCTHSSTWPFTVFLTHPHDPHFFSKSHRNRAFAATLKIQRNVNVLWNTITSITAKDDFCWPQHSLCFLWVSKLNTSHKEIKHQKMRELHFKLHIHKQEPKDTCFWLLHFSSQLRKSETHLSYHVLHQEWRLMLDQIWGFKHFI